MTFKKKNVVEKEKVTLQAEGGLNLSVENKNIGICSTVDTVCDEESTETETEMCSETENY